MRQCFQIGNKTLPLISVTGIIIGLGLTFQMRPALLSFGAVSLLPGMVAVSLIREMECIVRLLEPGGGTINVLGENVSALDHDRLGELRKKIGFLFQSGALYDSMTVKKI